MIFSEPIEVSVDGLQGSWTSDHCSETTGSFLMQIDKSLDWEQVQQILGLGYQNNFDFFLDLNSVFLMIEMSNWTLQFHSSSINK